MSPRAATHCLRCYGSIPARPHPEHPAHCSGECWEDLQTAFMLLDGRRNVLNDRFNREQWRHDLFPTFNWVYAHTIADAYDLVEWLMRLLLELSGVPLSPSARNSHSLRKLYGPELLRGTRRGELYEATLDAAYAAYATLFRIDNYPVSKRRKCDSVDGLFQLLSPVRDDAIRYFGVAYSRKNDKSAAGDLHHPIWAGALLEVANALAGTVEHELHGGHDPVALTIPRRIMQAIRDFAWSSPHGPASRMLAGEQFARCWAALAKSWQAGKPTIQEFLDAVRASPMNEYDMLAERFAHDRIMSRLVDRAKKGDILWREEDGRFESDTSNRFDVSAVPWGSMSGEPVPFEGPPLNDYRNRGPEEVKRVAWRMWEQLNSDDGFHEDRDKHRAKEKAMSRLRTLATAGQGHERALGCAIDRLGGEHEYIFRTDGMYRCSQCGSRTTIFAIETADRPRGAMIVPEPEGSNPVEPT